MLVYVMRHGDAQRTFSNDAERALTEIGQQECLSTAKWLSEQVSQIDLALVSPYVRAQQSFMLVKELVHCEKQENTSDLTPSADPDVICDYIEALASQYRDQSLLLVSHMPLVSSIVDGFCHRDYSLLFATASVTVIEIQGAGTPGVLLNRFSPQF